MLKEIKYNRIISKFNNFLNKSYIHNKSTNVNIFCMYNAMSIYSYSYFNKVLLLYNVDINQMSEIYSITKKNVAILISEHFSKIHNINLSDIEITIYTPNKSFKLFEYDKGNKI